MYVLFIEEYTFFLESLLFTENFWLSSLIISEIKKFYCKHPSSLCLWENSLLGFLSSKQNHLARISKIPCEVLLVQVTSERLLQVQ